jgi:predicted protein tyrosine phosphatase
MLNILFVCSRNQWRSLTAEKVFRNYAGVSVKSAGTENAARIRISEKLVKWAHIIFVMEKKHRQRIDERFPSHDKEVIILDIPDNYEFMDEELIQIIKKSVEPFLTNMD